MRRRFLPNPLIVLLAVTACGVAGAQETAPMTALDDSNILWTCLAAFLVFFMQAGFAFVEGGFTRAKNLSNILMKNLMDFSIGSLVFWAIGFGLMFGIGTGIFGMNSFFFDPSAQTADGTTLAAAAGQSVNFGWAFLIFQTVFAATAATIVSGAMAERTKFIGYLFYSVLITAIVYPIFGHWAWGSLFNGDQSQGFLERMGFADFAGSTVVHSIGAWCALAGAIVIGPRLGKYGKDGKPRAIPGHNMAMGALGVFILWLGWFGFNPGSTTAVGGGDLAKIAVNTNLAAAAGAVAAMAMSWMLFKKPDISMSLNGALAGLVAITAGCDAMTAGWSAVTGLIAGAVVVGSVLMFEKVRVDDPVGAISVHGVCGAWGTVAIGFFATESGLLFGYGPGQLVTQLIGVGIAFAWAFPMSLGIFYLIKVTVGLRVSPEEEVAGLDISEHGLPAYHGFILESGRGVATEPVPEAVLVPASSTAPDPAV